MNIRWPRFNRKTHYWGAIICALPVIIVLITGMLLLLKKEISWLQPPTIRGESKVPTLNFDQLLAIARTVPEAGITDWGQIKRIDVRPSKGIAKIQTPNQWEIQIDSHSGKILQVAYRRSDTIEALHDGTYFHDKAKLWVFLPAAVILFTLWVTGIYLFLLPYMSKSRSKKRHKNKVMNKTVENNNEIATGIS
ncbi:MAG: PepSY-associated TM helix domain-containing protein [Pseudomonadales bacterium]